MRSIRTRLLALTVGAAAALILVCGFAVLRFQHLTDDIAAADRRLEVLRAHDMLDMMHDALHSDALGALLAVTPAELDERRADAGEHRAFLNRELDILRQAAVPAALGNRIARATPMLAAYADQVEKIIGLALTDRAGAMALLPELERTFRELEDTNGQIGDDLARLGPASLARAGDTRRSVIGLIALCAVAAVVTVGGSMLIGRRLVTSLHQAAAALRATADGDFRARIDTDDPTEVGDMLRSLDTSLVRISEMLGSLRASTRALHTTASDVDQVSTALAVNSKASAAETTNAAAAAARASGNIQTVAAATEEIAATIRDVARHAEEAAKVATNGVAIAHRSNESMSRLGQASTEIGAVVDLITGIAEQTNLLALNATIEAARAGAAGRGFAVVAHEIKELAKQTARATEKIRANIGGVQRETEAAIADIGQIGLAIGQIDTIQRSIAASVAEQATVTSDIGRNLGEVAGATDAIAREVAALDHSIRDNTTAASQAATAGTSIGTLARDLEATISRFRFRGEDGRPRDGGRERQRPGYTSVRVPTIPGHGDGATTAGPRAAA